MTGKEELHKSVRIAVIAWMLAAIYYFYQYALRSAPAVMMPELSNAFGISPLASLPLSVCSITDTRHSVWSLERRWID